MPKGAMAYPATIVSAVLWSIAVAIAAAFSHVTHGLRRAVSDIRRLGQYTLEQKIGEGGMGVVYRASHGMLRRPTAIKLLPPDRSGKEAVARFEREVRRTAMLTHPNTVTVFDYGRTTDGVFYYAMELLDGASLQRIVDLDGPQPEERVIHLLDQAAASLAEAHDAGLIHRDIKPANILVVDRGGVADVVKVLDFGLVKDVGYAKDDAEPAVTAQNVITGTPLYIAPETLTAPETVDARTDLYSLGAVGYWLLTGTHVFGGKSILEVCAQHLHSPPEPPAKRLGAGDREPTDFEKILLACLAKRPDDRPSSAHVLRERLRGCASYGKWTSARAAQWWKTHGEELRAADASRSEVVSQVTVTRGVAVEED
jgi:serine/threonine-protein kinase